MPSLHELLERLWADYVELNPHARAVRELLERRGERVLNDHIAFRSWGPPLGVDAIAAAFTAFGYRPAGEYDFKEKRLRARHYEHDDPELPKVFISELKVSAFSEELQQIVKRLLDQVPEETLRRWDLPVLGRPWEVRHEDYERLRSESEYAAWLAALGLRANHFTVDVNALTTFGSLQEVNAFLKAHGIALNESGGEIKGSPAVHLEQSSTLAGEVDVAFTDGTHRIPACYYEFAKRYPLPDGRLFNGFVPTSADKIFQSTDRR